MQDNSKLDGYDRQILSLLQKNGRLTNNEIADSVHLSPSQCSRRRAGLEDSGYIIGYHAKIDREKVGIPLISMISISMSTHTADSAQQLALLVQELPNVLEAYSLTGETDYSLKVVTADLKALSSFISGELLTHESVHQVKSAVVLDTIKETTALPIPQSSSTRHG